MGSGWAVQVLALFVLAGCGGGAGEGDPEETRSTTGAAVSQATKKLPWPRVLITEGGCGVLAGKHGRSRESAS